MNSLIMFSIVFAVLEWIGEYKRNRKLIYFSKPLVLIFLIFWFFTHLDSIKLFTDYELFPIFWFILGLIFCLIGDIFLMFQEQYFIAGLSAFFIGHVFYIIGFDRLLPPKQNLLPGIILLGMIIAISITVFSKLMLGIKDSKHEKIKIPLVIYTIVISTMLYSATITLLDTNWNYISALFVSFGALSFFVSDIMNAWDRFISPFALGRVKIMMTYHIAQITLGIGVVLHFVYPPDS
jgi:uncharacterized membrane protein YhhN